MQTGDPPPSRPMGLRRRDMALGGLALAGLSGPAAAAPARPVRMRTLPPQMSWTPEPPQRPAREGMADVGGAKLYYWDTGGPGEAVIFLHPGTGSAAIWGYQQPVLAAAGYRVIAYSRRGHFKSEAGDPKTPGTNIGDLRALAKGLGLERFHLVGFAAGGFILPDYALSHPEELYSMTIACSVGGVEEPAWEKVTQATLGNGVRDMPADFRELGPSYRTANPEGTRRWLELEHGAAPQRVRQNVVNKLTWSAIERIVTPTLLVTGSADLFWPPTRMMEYASHLQRVEAVNIADAAHSVYWEQPDAFNTVLIDFLKRNGRRR